MYFSLWVFYVCMVLAFLFKMPIFFIHFWIPREYVEATVSHPMILTNVLLKLGGWVWVASCFYYLFGFGVCDILVNLSSVVGLNNFPTIYDCIQFITFL